MDAMTRTEVAHERHIAGAGTTAAEWLAWPGLAAIHAVAPPELVAAGARTIIVAPHPDDEVLGCGGLLQWLAADQREVVLVAVTDGGASHPGSPLWPTRRLMAARRQETLAAWSVLGWDAPQQVRAGFDDGAVAREEPRLRSLLEDMLRPGDVVVSTWRHDGHPDHEATGRAAAAACRNAGARLLEVPIWAWHWARPGDTRLPWAQARRLVLAPDALARKKSAVACYRSQLSSDSSTGRPPVIAPTVVARLTHDSEVYFT
jgi:LmbE family N-acetylglucosaminyl deacetylase